MVRLAGCVAMFPLNFPTLDVETIPQKGTWFQLINADGTTQLNTGPNGLQKLDTIFRFAKKHKIYILLTLTNNWNPSPKTASPVRNTLSNDYGQSPRALDMHLLITNRWHGCLCPPIWDGFP
jgi:hypothetical protein